MPQLVLLTLLFFSLLACTNSETEPDIRTLEPILFNTAVLPPTVTPQPTLPRATPLPPTATPSPPLPETAIPLEANPVALSTLHPLDALSIADLKRRSYPGGTIQLRAILTTTATYGRHLFTYPSDGLTISGVMHLPKGPGPFPVIILNHGFIPFDEYWSGADTWRAADYLAQRGYLTLAPDFRCWGESDSPENYCGVYIEAWARLRAFWPGD